MPRYEQACVVCQHREPLLDNLRQVENGRRGSLRCSSPNLSLPRPAYPATSSASAHWMKEPSTRSPRHAAHVSTACDACRKRKVKCDGTHPVCTPCFRNSAQDQCTWTRKDGRRKTTRDEGREQLALVLDENSRLKAELLRLREASGIRGAQAGEPPLGLITSGAAVQALDTHSSAHGAPFDAPSDPMQTGGPRPLELHHESAAPGQLPHSPTGTYNNDSHFAAHPLLGFNFSADSGDAFEPASIECPAPALPWTVMADPNLLSTQNAITADAVQGGPHLDLPSPWDIGAETL